MKKGCESEKTKQKRSIELPVLGVKDETGSIARSKNGPWRAAVLAAVNLLMLAHIVQWLMMGTTLSPIEPSEAMYTLQRGAVNAGFIFFSLAIIATLIFGRFVCGWGCHILALQDLCAWLMKRIGITPRPFRSRLLVYVPLIAALYMFVWPTALRALAGPPDQPVIPPFTNQLITTEFWATFPPIAVAIPFLFICGFMTVYFLGSKGFCTYGCPYGGFFSVADKIAPGRIRVTDACNQCGHCTAVCTSNVTVHAEVKQYGAVVDPGCMKCMDCVSVCPNDALYFGWGKPAVAVSKKLSPRFSMTWAEEIFAAVVFLLSLAAVWDAYQLIPMLMALGIAPVTAFLAVRILKLFKSADSSFLRYNLKAGGEIKAAGWIFLALSFGWIALNVHTGFIRYHELFGTRAFEKIRIPDELALARPNPDPWLGASDKARIAEGRAYLSTATRFAFFTNADALPKLAWTEYLSGNTDRALELLERAAVHQTGERRALSLYYRGAILNRVGRYDEALVSLDRALAERPDLVAAREERGESFYLTNRKAEAVAEWREAVRLNPGLVIANLMLAGAVLAEGNAAESQAFEQQADRLTPNDPFFNWMIGLRLQNVGMTALADKHFKRAIQINPEFRFRRVFDPGR